jgi:hypothetical protein
MVMFHIHLKVLMVLEYNNLLHVMMVVMSFHVVVMSFHVMVVSYEMKESSYVDLH